MREQVTYNRIHDYLYISECGQVLLSRLKKGQWASYKKHNGEWAMWTGLCVKSEFINPTDERNDNNKVIGYV